MSESVEFYDQETLIYRLSDALREEPREVVFLLGSPLSAPSVFGSAGVPNVSGVIQLIEQEFVKEPEQLQKLSAKLSVAGSKSYQTAFSFLIGLRGQGAANLVIQRAVLQARTPSDEVSNDRPRLTDEECRLLELDSQGWEINPGLLALGSLVNMIPARFGNVLLTTNFDPLIQQAINRQGGKSWRTTLHSDGNLTQATAEGCNVVHLHGYWYGSDTLHVSRQLTQPRPHLKASLMSLLRGKLVVVCGYGGWDDVFTNTLFDLAHEDNGAPEILWTFFGTRPVIDSTLEKVLQVGIGRGRVSFYEGIDCNTFFPLLQRSWQVACPELGANVPTRSNPVTISPGLRTAIEDRAKRERLIEGDEEDRPPQFDLCLGRIDEITSLEATAARVVFITGIGGQGKSTLAAEYFARAQRNSAWKLFIWRDCKEEGERFENQLSAVIERLSLGEVSGTDLARQDIDSLVDILLGYISNDPILFVFDNVDHYVEHDNGQLKSAADVLVRKLLATDHRSQVVFTCRPAASYSHDDSLSLKLKGLSLEATLELFVKRGSPSSADEIAAAHDFTREHAFWLDLLAIQTVKRAPAVTLPKLLSDIGPIPEDTLKSIWSLLLDREQLVLRVLAETVKPTTEMEVGDYLSGYFNFNRASKALRSLKTQNLIVVKKLHEGNNVLELHPLVRHFVHTTFPPVERRSFISAILTVYKRIIGEYRSLLKQKPSLTVLQNWTQKAELDIVYGDYSEATATLFAVSDAFSASAYSREFTRVCRLLLERSNWVHDHAKLRGLDQTFRVHVENLCHLSELPEVDDLLDRYAMTVLVQDGRYVLYCNMRSYRKWIRGDFKSAVEWAKMGKVFIEDRKVKSIPGFDISHTLALAQRDAGEPEVALEYFLDEHALASVVDPDELDEDEGGAFYGNLGRCLHFMGQTDGALICYQKSALLIEKDAGNQQFLNQGYIRRWIGELLLARGQRRLATLFIEAARYKWERVSPLRETQLRELQESLRSSLVQITEGEDDVEAVFHSWVMGDYLDDIV